MPTTSSRMLGLQKSGQRHKQRVNNCPDVLILTGAEDECESPKIRTVNEGVSTLLLFADQAYGGGPSEQGRQFSGDHPHDTLSSNTYVAAAFFVLPHARASRQLRQFWPICGVL
jgi:hypothetical protein